MKTIAFWAYPALLLVAWLVFAAWTLSAAPTIEPSLRTMAAAGSRPSSSRLELAQAMTAAHRHHRAGDGG